MTKLSEAPTVNFEQNIFAVYDLLHPNGHEKFDTRRMILRLRLAKAPIKMTVL